MIQFVIGLIFCGALFLVSNDELMLLPKKWPQTIYHFDKNKLTKEKIFLGKVLFYDPVLSKDNTISCSSCHSSFNAFAHTDHALSHGIHDSIGKRNAPALTNLAWQKNFMWDGAITNLDMQSLAPISHQAEMDNSINTLVIKLNSSQRYKKLFQAAYNDSVVTGEHVLKAIAQFMLTIVSANSKYDKVMNQEEKFNFQEQNGYQIFKKNCASCHAEPLFTNGDFANNGIGADSLLNDAGRMFVTQNTADAYLFKIPTLRNIEYTFPYMHDGRFKKLSDVLNHYSNGINKSKTLSPLLKDKITLTSNEKVDLMAFLLTLSDKQFLFDKKFSFPKEILINQ